MNICVDFFPLQVRYFALSSSGINCLECIIFKELTSFFFESAMVWNPSSLVFIGSHRSVLHSQPLSLSLSRKKQKIYKIEIQAFRTSGIILWLHSQFISIDTKEIKSVTSFIFTNCSASSSVSCLYKCVLYIFRIHIFQWFGIHEMKNFSQVNHKMCFVFWISVCT